MNHKEYAMQLFKDGYNCSQAVAGAFTDVTGLDFDTTVKLASSFGGGFGRLREVCGAVSGMMIVIGLCEGYNSPTDAAAKKEHYEKVQKLAGEFSDIYGSIICRELLGIKKNEPGSDSSPVPSLRTKSYYQKRPCVEIVGTAAEILERYLQMKI